MELSSMPYFPVRDGDSGPCIGVVARSHLEAALQAACGGGPQAQLLPPMPTAPSSHATAHIDVVLQPISVVPACCDTASTPLQQLCGNEANYAADDEGLGDVVGAVVTPRSGVTGCMRVRTAGATLATDADSAILA